MRLTKKERTQMRKELMEMAEKCGVAKTITGNLLFEDFDALQAELASARAVIEEVKLTCGLRKDRPPFSISVLYHIASDWLDAHPKEEA